LEIGGFKFKYYHCRKIGHKASEHNQKDNNFIYKTQKEQLRTEFLRYEQSEQNKRLKFSNAINVFKRKTSTAFENSVLITDALHI